MRYLLSNDYVVLAVRVLVGFLFVVASIDKIFDPLAFATSIANYKVSLPDLDLLLATVLPWVELLCGLGILTGTLFRGSAFVSCMLSVVFALAVFSALVRGLDISCGCFSQDPGVGKINWQKLAENVGLVVMTFFLLYSSSEKFLLDKYLQSRPTNVSN